jgi:hypothetical protein
MLGLVYTIDPSFNPPDPKLAITMRPAFAADWSRTHPHIPIMLYQNQDDFAHVARILEQTSIHIERLVSTWAQ